MIVYYFSLFYPSTIVPTLVENLYSSVKKHSSYSLYKRAHGPSSLALYLAITAVNTF